MKTHTKQTAWIAAAAAIGLTAPSWAQQIEGELAADAEFDAVAVEVSEGQVLVVQSQSDDFDTVLTLVNADGETLATNDDDGVSTNSALGRVIDDAGTYTLRVSGFGEQASGAYTVSYDLFLPDEVVEEDGELSDDDDTLEDESYHDPFEVELEEGGLFYATLTSDDFDAFLLLTDAAGNLVMTVDDDGVSTNSAMVFRAPEAGTYTVHANSYGAGDTGNYELRYVIGGASDE